MTCKFCIYDRLDSNQDIVRRHDYTCDEVRELKEIWKKTFIEKNRTDYVIKSVGKDNDYCRNIEDFLSKCTCKG